MVVARVLHGFDVQRVTTSANYDFDEEVIMVNGKQAKELIRAMNSACEAVEALNAAGVTIKSVSLNGVRPVIRVKHCGYCDGLIDTGHATFFEFGCGLVGRYRQGRFYVGDCKVVWSESLH